MMFFLSILTGKLCALTIEIVMMSQIAETKQQIAILESYLEQRGVSVPEGYFSCRVVCPNPKFR